MQNMKYEEEFKEGTNVPMVDKSPLFKQKLTFLYWIQKREILRLYNIQTGIAKWNTIYKIYVTKYYMFQNIRWRPQIFYRNRKYSGQYFYTKHKISAQDPKWFIENMK